MKILLNSNVTGVMEENYADVNRRIRVLEHLINANESLRKKEEEFSALQHSFEVMEQNYADANKRVVVLEEHLRNANESLRKKEEELSSAVQHKFEVMEQNYADANKRIGVLEEHLTDANESLRKKEAELATLQHSFEVIERNYDAKKRIGEQLSAANESLRKKEEELTALKHSFGVTDQNYAASWKRIRFLEDQLSTVNESLRKKEEEFIALKHNFGDIEQNNAYTTKRIEVPDNLLSSTANDLLKVEVQKVQSICERLTRATDDAVEGLEVFKNPKELPDGVVYPMERLIWQVWAPPKCKFFSWLAFQNQLGTADRLIKPNQKVCMLCHAHDESNLHIFTQCRYSLEVWNNIFAWVAAHVPQRTDWSAYTSIDSWWTEVGSMHGAPLKGWRSLMILVCWELWKERNARVFHRNFLRHKQLFDKIKEEARAWVLAGAKHLGAITSFIE